MKKNVSIRNLSMVAMLTLALAGQELHGQGQVTAYASAGVSEIEVNGLGLLDLVDPYIKPIAQYSVGVQYEKEITSRLVLVTGGQYASRGFGARETFNINVFGLDLPVGARLETRLNYLEVPLMLKYNFVDKGLTPYVQAGVSTAYALNGKITPKIDALIPWQLPGININLQNDTYNRWDVSAMAGAGIRIPAGEYGAIQVGASYRHSLNDMFLDQVTDIRIKSHGISGSIGYSVRF